MKHKFEQQPPELINGILHQQLRVCHYDEYKTVNRAEEKAVAFIWDNFQKGNQPERIDEFRTRLMAYLSTLPKSYGSVIIGDIKKGSSIMGKPNLIERRFSVKAKGRSIPSIVLNEDIFIDLNNGDKIASPEECVYNKRIIGL